MSGRDESTKQLDRGPVELRPERDGTYRYTFQVGTQMIVSRESYPTPAEATRAGEVARQAM